VVAVLEEAALAEGVRTAPATATTQQQEKKHLIEVMSEYLMHFFMSATSSLSLHTSI
jgi:hypothetical protein